MTIENAIEHVKNAMRDNFDDLTADGAIVVRTNLAVALGVMDHVSREMTKAEQAKRMGSAS